MAVQSVAAMVHLRCMCPPHISPPRLPLMRSPGDSLQGIRGIPKALMISLSVLCSHISPCHVNLPPTPGGIPV